MSSSFGGVLLFSLIWLMLAAALIWVVAFIVKKDSAIRANNPHIQVLAQQPIGPRERVLVVNVLNRILVLGHTNNQINLLIELDPEDVANLTPHPSPINFADNLRRFVKRNLG